MSDETVDTLSAPSGPVTGGAVVSSGTRRRRGSNRSYGDRITLDRMTRRDKFTLALMVGIPTLLCLGFIWLPTIFSIGLSFTDWRGIQGLTWQNFIGLNNYVNLFTKYPFFWPAVPHNVLWLLVLTFIATPIGIFFAVLLDREMRGSRIYQSASSSRSCCPWPSSGSSGTMYAPQGVINSLLGTDPPGQRDRLAGQPNINIWAVLVAASWRHVGYIMVLYLAGPEERRPDAA